MHIHEEVLVAANAIAARRKDWIFTVKELVRALPHLNVSSVRTHVVSRCCVDAPKNHLHKWDYFRRVGRGEYQVLPPHRRKKFKPLSQEAGPSRRSAPGLRETIHVVVSRDQDTYVAECLELPVVTQGATLDELVHNIREALALHLEGEDPASFGLQKDPRLQMTYELSRAV